MTHKHFFIWLRGFAELTYDAPTEAQWGLIKRRLMDTPMPDPEEYTISMHDPIPGKPCSGCGKEELKQ